MRDRAARIRHELKRKNSLPAFPSYRAVVPPVPKHLTVAQAMELAKLKSEGTARGWNEEFQELWNVGSEDTYNYKPLSVLIKDFCSVVDAYGRVIISEKFIPDKLKSIKPLSSEDNTLYCVEGILFTFILDRLTGYSDEGEEIYLYGGSVASDEKAMKTAVNSLRSMSYLLDCYVEGLRLPLKSLVHFRGFCLHASSLLPIRPSDLVYGRGGEGGIATTNKNDPKVNII